MLQKVKAYQGFQIFPKKSINFSGNKLPVGRLIEADNSLLDGYISREMNSLTDYCVDKFVAVHMTDYSPNRGVIKSTRDATKDPNGVAEVRNTVHFSLNHVVESHGFGNWDNKSFAILAPLKKFIENCKENIVGGVVQDFFMKNSVKLPEGTIIIRKSSQIPEGKLKVINAEVLDEFKGTKGIKIVETSQSIKDTATTLVKKMGFSTLTNPSKRKMEYGKHLEYLNDENKAWAKFTKEHGFKYCYHGYSPIGRAESLINCLNVVARNSDSWIKHLKKTEYREEMTVDYQKEILDIVQEIKTHKTKDDELTFNIDKYEECIKTSKTPNEAIEKIKKELKFISPDKRDLNKEIPSDEIGYSTLRMVFGLDKEYKKEHNTPLEVLNTERIQEDIEFYKKYLAR